MSNSTIPPADDELEVSIFGPGIGESVVVHVGNGDWVIVDSCMATGGRLPVGIQYLNDLGVDPAASVRLIIATHFHDDHIRGLCAVVEACPAARFVCSAALGVQEFFQLLEANNQLDVDEPGTGEFDRILQLLDARSELHGRRVTPDYALDGTILYERTDAPLSSQLRALSPSSATITAAHLRVGRLVPSIGEPKKPTTDIGANELSLALWLRLGAASAVLGGDLEERGRAGEGWRAVVASRVRPTTKATVFKVPHHGSPTARHADVWTQMLEPNPVAVVTPYARGARKLPARSDLDWLCKKTPKVHVTSLGLGRVPRARPSAVEREVKRTARDRRTIGTDMGQVRVRIQSSSGVAVTEMFGAAYAACLSNA